ncbi:MAG: hypothetical protein Ct9H300mP23_05430 [Nitrospinota bacterium]|nr:MAG: hypothetical protein Ct9H300mP23_05430 [Nitrospinota bacterium]
MSVCAIVPAGGSGTRMGGTVPKQFQSLNGKPILYHTLKTLQNCGIISEIILVVQKKNMKLPKTHWLGKLEIVKKVVMGVKKDRTLSTTDFAKLLKIQKLC